jgi:hypothetical protein
VTTKDPQATIRRRVRRGVKFLDTYGPKDWRKRINVETLDMAENQDCILGQIYPKRGFSGGLSLLLRRAFGKRYDGRYLFANRHAFCVSQTWWPTISGLAEYRMLDDTWKRELAR